VTWPRVSIAAWHLCINQAALDSHLTSAFSDLGLEGCTSSLVRNVLGDEGTVENYGTQVPPSFWSAELFSINE
jgi:hypothetical protein